MNYFVTISKRKFILLSLIIPFIYTLSLALLSNFIEIGPINKETLFQNSSLFKIFFLLVILGPFIETLVFQVIVIEIITKIFKQKNQHYIGILASGFAFGLAHYTNTHNPIYTFFAIIAGILFASIYVFSKIRKDINPFILVFFSHSLINFFSFLINHLFNKP